LNQKWFRLFFYAQKLHKVRTLLSFSKGLIYVVISTQGEKNMWIHYNPNPTGRSVDDCAVRAVSKALSMEWEDAYIEICSNGLAMGDMPHADSV
jgi:hypothetical protein